MSAHHALQRVLVRMQLDPAFADRVYADAESALRGLGLGARERGWLVATDRRAFRHDPLRRRRTLRGLMEELKASSAIALAETRRLAFLEAFFGSAWFHDTVQARGSLVLGFASYLLEAGLVTPQLPEVVRLESQLCKSRRELAAAGGAAWRPPPVPKAGLDRVARAPGVAAGRFSPDALAAIQAVEQYLFEIGLVPAVVLADDAPRLALPAATGALARPLGFIPTASGISLVELEPELHAAIAALEHGPRPVREIGEALARALIEDEVLVPV